MTSRGWELVTDDCHLPQLRRGGRVRLEVQSVREAATVQHGRNHGRQRREGSTVTRTRTRARVDPLHAGLAALFAGAMLLTMLAVAYVATGGA